jgi:hypothetical protein
MQNLKTYLPLFTGFYGSIWDDISFYGEDEYYNLPNDKIFYDFVDWQKYYKKIAKEMCNEVENLLSDFVNEIKFESIVSPKYYNFENDSINCEIVFFKEKIFAYLLDNSEAFESYLKENYTSRDGFISSYSNKTSDWQDFYNDSHKLGSVLQFICENEGFEEPTDLKDIHISNFYTSEIDQYFINQ